MTINRCEPLERAAVLAERRGEPVEQLGVARGAPHPAEVVGRVDQPPAEVREPGAVDDRPPGQRVLRVGDPSGQGGASRPFVGQSRTGRRALRRTPRAPGTASVAGLADVASLQDEDRPRRRGRLVGAVGGEVARGGVDEPRGGKRRELTGRASRAR